MYITTVTLHKVKIDKKSVARILDLFKRSHIWYKLIIYTLTMYFKTMR
jgi:hypothetical protein